MLFSTCCSPGGVLHLLFFMCCFPRAVLHVLFSMCCSSCAVLHVLLSMACSSHDAAHMMLSTCCPPPTALKVLLTTCAFFICFLLVPFSRAFYQMLAHTASFYMLLPSVYTHAILLRVSTAQSCSSLAALYLLSPLCFPSTFIINSAVQ